jgi:hypothetical protein
VTQIHFADKQQVCEHLRVPAESLAAPRIAVEQSGKNNIFFGKVAGTPGNYSY